LKFRAEASDDHAWSTGRPDRTPISDPCSGYGNGEPLWGAPRIHGELRTLGFAVSERTVSRLLEQQTSAFADIGGRF
jgi:hypothetical protein